MFGPERQRASLLETALARQDQFPIDFQPHLRHSVILVWGFIKAID